MKFNGLKQEDTSVAVKPFGEFLASPSMSFSTLSFTCQVILKMVNASTLLRRLLKSRHCPLPPQHITVTAF
jgi:hypothetical protein